ncbi:MAG: PLP-dependent aspartate aminotransferase family protein [Planctomycetes bacterium]|nr:PLP-dependent aspartate aminotransferase family protein [Planctomycetota bacterium]
MTGPRFGTRAVHGGQEPDPSTGAIMTPVYLTSTFVQPQPARPIGGYDYSRTKNPTRVALEANLASLEGGTWGLAFGSGMAAIHAALGLLSAGDHVVAGDDLYGGTFRLFRTVLARQGLRFTFVDPSDPSALEGALSSDTKMLFVETPTNPLLRLVDLRACAAAAKARGLLSVCDNTFATPALQTPLSLGFDLVVHSTTKYLGGHSDVVGGAVVGRDEGLRARLAHLQNAIGAVPGPLDCFLVLRGTKTLHLRMERHCRNAGRVAEFLAGHPKVARVLYPGLPSHPQHALARSQMSGSGGIVSLELKGGGPAAIAFASSTRWFALAESLGGVESLVDHPASMTHASVPEEKRRAAGLSDSLVRLSVGVEDAEDLLEDLDRALAKA